MDFKPGAPLVRCTFLATFMTVNYSISAAGAVSALPVYPAAKTQPISAGVHSIVSRCGHRFTMEKSMTVDADPNAVAKWYQSRLPGSRTIDLSRALSDEGDTNRTTTIQVFAADGSQTVVVSRMHFDGALANASKTLGMDKTDIGIEGISPPLAPGYIELTAQAATGGASGQKAKRQMEAACR